MGCAGRSELRRCAPHLIRAPPRRALPPLGFLLAGGPASVLVNADEPTLVRRVLESLPAELRREARESLIEARVHRWCGGVSGRPGGLPAREPLATHQLDPDRLPGLLLVGDYLFDSTLNGVYASADLATTLLARHVRRAGPRVRGRSARTAGVTCYAPTPSARAIRPTS